MTQPESSPFPISRRETVAAAAAAFATAAMIPARLVAAAPEPSDPFADGQVARLDGVDLWYWDTGGEGEPLVLLHPATGSGHVWEYQRAVFAQAGYRTIGYSRRGYRGSSSGTPGDAGSAAGDLRLLADRLGLGPMHLVGTAAGGFVAASFAIAHPDRVRSLTIACSIVTTSDPAMRKLVPWLYEAWWNALPEDLRELGPTYRATDPEGQARWNALHERSRGEGPRVSQPAGDVPATIDTLSRLAVPTLLLSGGADLISPPPVARLLHATIAGSELAVIPECGHSAYWERPDDFNAAVLGFVRRHHS